KELTQVLAAPGATALRQPWRDETGELSPARLAMIMRAAIEGDAEAYLTLAEEMEERELHYRSVLDTRTRAVTGLKPKVTAAGEDKADVELADSLREQVRKPGFRRMVKDLMDAVGKGFSVVENLWEPGADKWNVSFAWRDPRFFRYDFETGEELRLIDEQDALNGIELPENKFIIHQPALKSGLQIRAGLAFAAAFSYMCKTFTMFNWMNFADVYGMPLRLGRYGPNAKPADIAVLRNAVNNIGSDAAAVMPESMRIEFQELKSQTDSSEFFINLAKFFDAQISKLVLGQVRTTDELSSGLHKSSEADGKDEVRADIQVDDVAELNETVNRYFVIPFINLNHGVQENYPLVELVIPENRDVAGLVNALDKLIPLGLKVQQSEIRDILNLTHPDDDAELLQPPGIVEPAAGRALARAFAGPDDADPDTADRFAAQLGSRMKPIMGALMEPIRRLVEHAQSFDEIRDGLDALYPDMDTTDFVNLMANAMLAAELAGRAEVEEGR
ncbi:MAG: DUF935 domain-containing protein, partial [Gammaproteobacteria bacterium]|nr:DUF935 domain-containing protein [Gammaproteobacteria bacterium]